MLRRLFLYLKIAAVVILFIAAMVFPGGPVDKYRAYAKAAEKGADLYPGFLERLEHVHHKGDRTYYINSWRKRRISYEHFELVVQFDGLAMNVKETRILNVTDREPELRSGEGY